jgi:transcriptional regulator of acetoin/glycerol metabolism
MLEVAQRTIGDWLDISARARRRLGLVVLLRGASAASPHDGRRSPLLWCRSDGRVAAANVTVLICGESGTGKEVAGQCCPWKKDRLMLRTTAPAREVLRK